MPELPSHPDTGHGARPEPDLGTTSGASRWKTAIGIAVGILAVVVFVVLHLTGVVGPGEH